MAVRKRKSIPSKDDESESVAEELPKSEEKMEPRIFPRTLFRIVLGLSFLTRLFFLHHPHEVVFDEVHFGKFASEYLRREYYFDVHPPLGKMLFALVGYLCFYDGHFNFDTIGLDYFENNVPYIILRLFPALLGSMVAPLAFLTLWEMNVSPLGCAMGALLIIFDNALVTQTRLILLDAVLIAGIMLSMYAWVKFYRLREEPYSFDWWKWLTITGLGLSLAIGTKLVGLFVILLVGFATLTDLWRLFDFRRGHSDLELSKHFLARALCLIVLPISIYIGSFYVHFAVLVKSGSGDKFMSSEFQQTLDGSRLSGKSYPVYYGVQLTIRSAVEEMYLHSHVQRYPLRHNENKVSSEGQQVTGYGHEDFNNMWMFHLPENETNADERVQIKNGDIVRLRHVATNSFLKTHDVASPLTMTNMEVTTTTDDDQLNSTLFKIEIETGQEAIKTIRVHFRLVHVETGVSIFNYQKNLPEWGFSQREINGLKSQNVPGTHWFVQDLNSTLDFDPKDIDGDENVKKVGFWKKLLELQGTMLSANANLKDDHPFASSPFSWPFVIRGISFWQKKDDQSQIYLLGNPAVWFTAIVCVLLLMMLMLVDSISERRGCPRLDYDESHQLYYSGGFLLGSYFLHYIPFFLMGRVLFLHHYLPALIISCMITGFVFDFMFRHEPKSVYRGICLVIVVVVVGMFIFFAPLSYGFSVSTEYIALRQFSKNWDFSIDYK